MYQEIFYLLLSTKIKGFFNLSILRVMLFLMESLKKTNFSQLKQLFCFDNS